MCVCVYVCVTFTCQSVCRNAPQTLGVLGEASASLTVPSSGDPVILVCQERIRGFLRSFKLFKYVI